MRIRSAVALVPLACLALASGCAKPSAQALSAPAAASDRPRLFTLPQNQLSRLKLVKVVERDVALPLHVPAQVTFDDWKTTQVMPLVSGRVAKVMVREGSRVWAGEPLLTIQSPDSSDNTANLKRDQATLDTKLEVLNRDKDLYAHQAIALEELQNAKLDVESAKASLQDDQARMKITGSGSASLAVVRSPLTGLVVSRTVSVGEAVQAGGSPLFTITDPSLVWVIAHVYPEDIRRVALGDQVAIHSAALGLPLTGRVTYIGAAVDPDTLTVPIRVEVENRSGLLKQGLYVDALITPSNTQPSLLVPNDAILRDEDNLPFVYLAKSPGRFARQHISLGERMGNDTLVTGGLKQGETVLASGALYVQFADSLEN